MNTRMTSKPITWHARTAAMLLVLILCQQPLGAQLLPGSGDSLDKEIDPVADVIEVEEASRPNDSEIESRLNGIYRNLPGLEAVSVNVSDGVVILAGTVDDSETMEKAGMLAERLEGAVVVINNIGRDRSIAVRLKAATRSIGLQFKDLIGNAPLLLLAIVIIAVGVFAARAAGNANWLFDRLSANWFVRDLVRQVLQVALLFCAVVIALKLLDATALLGSLVGALGIVGLAVGFATRDTVENYIASMLLSLRQPFRSDDYISVEGVEGKVLRLTPRATVLMSNEGNHLRIPNSKVYKATIINYTRNPLRRFDFEVGVDTGIDLNLPRDIAVQTLSKISGVLETPEPQCLVRVLGDSSVVLTILGWIDQREHDFQKTRSEAQRLVKDAFDEAGIVMPEPIYNVNLRRQKVASPRKNPVIEPKAIDLGRDVGNTERTDEVEQQMQNERRNNNEEDLLSKDAPVE